MIDRTQTGTRCYTVRFIRTVKGDLSRGSYLASPCRCFLMKLRSKARRPCAHAKRSRKSIPVTSGAPKVAVYQSKSLRLGSGIHVMMASKRSFATC